MGAFFAALSLTALPANQTLPGIRIAVDSTLVRDRDNRRQQTDKSQHAPTKTVLHFLVVNEN